MRQVIIFAGAICLLMSCSRPNKAIKDRLTNSDSVAINYFRGDGSMDTVVAIKIIRNPQQVEQLVNLVSAKSAKGKFTCGYDGSLHFFKMNKVIQDIDFRMNDEDCRYFSFKLNGTKQATQLSEEARQWIESLRK